MLFTAKVPCIQVQEGVYSGPPGVYSGSGEVYSATRPPPTGRIQVPPPGAYSPSEYSGKIYREMRRVTRAMIHRNRVVHSCTSIPHTLKSASPLLHSALSHAGCVVFPGTASNSAANSPFSPQRCAFNSCRSQLHGDTTRHPSGRFLGSQESLAQHRKTTETCVRGGSLNRIIPNWARSGAVNERYNMVYLRRHSTPSLARYSTSHTRKSPFSRNFT